MTSPAAAHHPDAPVRKATIVGIGIASALVPLNSTMISVALRSVAHDFDITKQHARILVTIYLIGMLAGQPVWGLLCDVIRPKRLVLIALVGFGACSIAAAASPSFGFLVGARTMQALFASALSPGVQAMLRAVTRPGERGRAFGILSSVIGVGVVVGPLLGGQLVDGFDWHAIFLVNIPVVLLCFGMLWRVDVPTLPRRSMPIAGSGLGGPASLPLRPPPAEPVTQSDWVTFGASVATQALSNFGQYLLLFMVPAVLDAQGWSSRNEGYVLTAMTATLIITGPIGGRMADRIGRARPMLGGFTLAAIGMAALIPFGTDIHAATFVVTLAIFGMGYGLAGPPLNAAAIEAVSADRTGVAAGVLSASRYVGSIISTILISAIVADDASGSTTMFVIGLAVLLASIASAVVVVRSRPVRSSAKGVGRTDRLDDRVRTAVHDERLPEHEAGVS